MHLSNLQTKTKNKKMKKAFSIAFATLALTMISCSDEQEVFEKNNDKVVVEQLSSPNVTRSAKTNNGGNSEIPATYRVSYKGVVADNVQLLPSFASTLQNASGMGPWQYKTLRGYTETQPDKDGNKGGQPYKLLINKTDAAALGIKNGIYTVKNVIFINTFELPSEYCFCMKGSITPGAMGKDPEHPGTVGFTLTQTGKKIVCKTRGYLILTDPAGAQYNMSNPRKLEFNIQYFQVYI